MTDLFLKVLNLSFSATWVVLGVVLARFLLKKAPRNLVCALWALVALRLLFGGIEAPVSLIPSAEIIPPDSLFDQAPVIHSGISTIDNAVNLVYSESLRPAPGASVNPLQVWLAVFANLWGLGVGAMALWAGISCIRVRRQVRESILDDGVYLCDRIASPFIFGLFRPKIYLPSDLGGASRAHVIAHERAHMRRRDHWWKPLGFALLTVNWFNPAIWLAYLLLCRDIELACDERVIQSFTAEEKKSYSAALLRCSVNPRRITACPLAFGEVGVKQRIQSVLNYKKPAFWIVLLALVLTVVLAAGLLTDPLSPPAEIRYQGNLYIESGRPVREIPDKQESSDTLRSVLHDSTLHPNENNQAVNLGWEYAGQPMVQVGNALYLQNPGGDDWMRFVLLHSPGNVHALLQKPDVRIDLALEGESVSILENVQNNKTGDFGLQLLQILGDTAMQPSMEWDTSMLAVNYAENSSILIIPKGYHEQCLLTRREDDWLMVYRDEDWAVTAWAFHCPELDELLTPWKNELAYSTELFAPLATADAPILLQYVTLDMEDTSLRVGIPTSGIGFSYTTNYWDWEGHTSNSAKAMTIRCRPAMREDWMEIHYSDSVLLSRDLSRKVLLEQITTRGSLKITTPKESDWTERDYKMAVTIAKTISLTQSGTSLMGVPSSLGLTIRLENITPGGATLICTQDGTPWDQIITGAPWNLERLENGQWISLMPESTTWTTVAYGLNANTKTRFDLNWSQITGSLEPGHYRISKTFTGERRPPFSLGIENETTRETCYAEFDIADGFSPALHQAIRDSWTAYDSMSPMMQLASSTLPGSCTRDFDRWDDVEQFVGVTIPNPLETLDHLVKGNWAAAPEGYNGGSRFHVTFQGTREGQVQQLTVVAGYRLDDLRMTMTAQLCGDLPISPPGESVFSPNSGEGYEARTGMLTCGNIQYTLRVLGDPGTGDRVSELLQELRSYFEDLPAA